MSTEEFSNQFDTLLNSFSQKIEFGNSGGTSSIVLDEYEKSVLLTQALEELVLEYYTGRNPFNLSFELTEEVRRYLSNLIKTATLSPSQEEFIISKLITAATNHSRFFVIPEDVLFLTYELVSFNDERLGLLLYKKALVIPVTLDILYKVLENPFKGPNENRILRLDMNSNIIELVSIYIIDKYNIRYITKPTPIILTTLSDDIKINNISEKTECTLHSFLHKIILERAVQLALLLKGININK